MRKNLAFAGLLFLFLACDDGLGYRCYDAVTLCGVQIGPFSADEYEASSGCNESSGTAWSYSAGALTCDGAGLCSGELEPFDLRASGYDAQGFLAVTATLGSFATVRAVQVCDGDDCDAVHELLGTATCDAEAASANHCDAGYDDYYGYYDEPETPVVWSFDRSCDADGWSFEVVIDGGYADLTLTDGVREETHAFRGDALDLGVVALEDLNLDETTAFPCESEPALGFRVDLRDGSDAIVDCAVFAGSDTSAVERFSDDLGGCVNGDAW